MFFIEDLDLLVDLFKEDKGRRNRSISIKRKVALCFLDLLVDLLMEDRDRIGSSISHQEKRGNALFCISLKIKGR